MKLKAGRELFFHTTFKEADGDPITPSDPTESPSFSIFDPDGIELISGVATEESEAGLYTASWICPDNAQLTTSNGPHYEIIWNMITSNNKQIEKKQTFELVSGSFEFDSEWLSYSYVTLASKDLPIKIVLEDEVESISLSVGTSANETPSIQAEYPKSTDLSMPEISMERSGNYVVYTYTIPAASLAEGTELLAVWSVQETSLDPVQQHVQLIEVPYAVFWDYSFRIKQIGDKLHKAANLHQHITESQMLFGLNQGVDNLNSYYPLTEWNYWEVPTYFRHFLILTTMIWIFEGQLILAGEGQFSFGGQTVTLDYDPSGVYESAIGRWKDDLVRFELVKKNYNYKRALGHMATRFPINVVAGRSPTGLSGIGMFPWYRVLS